MKQRLLLALIALMGLTAMAQTTNYGIRIGGKDVTSSNYTNISATGDFSAVKSGTVTYDPSTQTLTLSNAIISTTGSTKGIVFYSDPDETVIGIEGYHLVLAEGTANVVTTGTNPALETTMPLTISGGGTALFRLTDDGHCGIYGNYSSGKDYTLTIENSTVAAIGKWGISGNSGDAGTLRIVNSTVIATGAQGSVCDWKTLTTTGVELTSPSGAAWSNTNHAVCDVQGTKLTSTVTFKPKSSSGSGSTGSGRAGDMNGDGLLTISDVTALVDVILNSSSDFGTHEYVDLGLPSGTLWATTNIGATNPEDYGDYFAWGETVPYGKEDRSNLTNYESTGSYVKRLFGPFTYKYCASDHETLTKYCDKSEYGYNGSADNLTELELEDDAAYVNWGPEWRIPTQEQCQELVDNTTTVWTTVNGIYGRRMTSKMAGYEDKSIFLPVAGGHGGEEDPDEEPILNGVGIGGFYLSSALSNITPYLVSVMWVVSDEEVDEEEGFKAASVRDFGRVYGLSVRPVRAQ